MILFLEAESSAPSETSLRITGKSILIGAAIVVGAEVCLADIGGENDLMTYIVAWSSVSQGTFFISKIAAKILAYLRQ